MSCESFERCLHFALDESLHKMDQISEAQPGCNPGGTVYDDLDDRHDLR